MGKFLPVYEMKALVEWRFSSMYSSLLPLLDARFTPFEPSGKTPLSHIEYEGRSLDVPEKIESLLPAPVIPWSPGL